MLLTATAAVELGSLGALGAETLVHTGLAALELAALGSLRAELAGLGTHRATALVLTGLGAMRTTPLVLHTGLAMTMTTAHTGLLVKLTGITCYISVASSDSFLGADYTVVVGVNRSAGNRSRSGSSLRSGALSEYRHRSGEQEEYGFLHILYCGLC